MDELGGEVGARRERVLEWAAEYRGVAILGFLSTLLTLAHVLHVAIRASAQLASRMPHLQTMVRPTGDQRNRWRRLTEHLPKVAATSLAIPPCVLAGIIGAAVVALVDSETNHMLSRDDQSYGSAVRATLVETMLTLVNLVWSSAALGFATSPTSLLSRSTTTRNLARAVLHEGLPMLVYSQIVAWGQSCVAICVAWLYSHLWSTVHPLTGALVTLGLESGSDVSPALPVTILPAPSRKMSAASLPFF